MNISSVKDYFIATGAYIGSVVASETIRQMKAPTPHTCGLAAIQATASTSTYCLLKWLERKVGLIDDFTVNKRSIIIANYIVSQALSIGLTIAALVALRNLGIQLNSSISLDFSHVLAVVTHSTFLTLLVRGVYDLARSSH